MKLANFLTMLVSSVKAASHFVLLGTRSGGGLRFSTSFVTLTQVVCAGSMDNVCPGILTLCSPFPELTQNEVNS
jgi:hypothetical protein